MNKLAIISVFFLLSALVIGCHDNSKPGLDYMPDMKNSRAYETYADFISSESKGKFLHKFIKNVYPFVRIA